MNQQLTTQLDKQTKQLKSKEIEVEQLRRKLQVSEEKSACLSSTNKVQRV